MGGDDFDMTQKYIWILFFALFLNNNDMFNSTIDTYSKNIMTVAYTTIIYLYIYLSILSWKLGYVLSWILPIYHSRDSIKSRAHTNTLHVRIHAILDSSCMCYIHRLSMNLTCTSLAFAINLYVTSNTVNISHSNMHRFPFVLQKKRFSAIIFAWFIFCWRPGWECGGNAPYDPDNARVNELTHSQISLLLLWHFDRFWIGLTETKQKQCDDFRYSPTHSVRRCIDTIVSGNEPSSRLDNITSTARA